MSRRRRREESDSLNLSFLDAISCGFGAVILLLVITLLFEPATIQETRADVQGLIERLQKELFEIRGETEALTLEDQRAALRRGAGAGPAPGRPDEDPRPVPGQRAAGDRERRDGRAARGPPAADRGDAQAAGGLPAAGGRHHGGRHPGGQRVHHLRHRQLGQHAVRLAHREGEGEGDAGRLPAHQGHPGVQQQRRLPAPGHGPALDPGFAQQPRPDRPGHGELAGLACPTRRRASSTAINTFYAPDKRISIFVFGDDFQGRVVEGVIRQIESVNKPDGRGSRLVRIHGVGFPTGEASANPAGFAAFMRALCDRSGGTFVALTQVQQGPRIIIRGPGG